MKKRILMILEQVPFPKDSGGRIRTASILKYLSIFFDIDVIAYSQAEVEKQYINELSSYTKNLHIFQKGKPSYLKHLLFFLKRKSGIASGIYSSSMQKYILKQIEENDYQFLWFERLFTTIYLNRKVKSIFKGKIIVNTHDVDHLSVFQMYLNSSNILRKIYWKNEYHVVARMEKHCIKNADMILVVSSIDKNEYIKEFNNPDKFYVCPNGVEVRPLDGEGLDKRLKKSFLFVGSLDYVFNNDAICWFLQEIWPFFLKKVPDASFTIVGSGTPKQNTMHIIEESKNTIFKGRVDSIEPFYGNYSALVVPLLSGSGTRIKILESFSYGMPVISTSKGAEGLTDSEAVLIADSPEEFLGKMECMCFNYSSFTEHISKGYYYVRDNYSWESLVSNLVQNIGKITNEKN